MRGVFMVKKGLCPVSFLWRAMGVARVFKRLGLLLISFSLIYKGLLGQSLTEAFFLGLILWALGALLNAKKPSIKPVSSIAN